MLLYRIGEVLSSERFKLLLGKFLHLFHFLGVTGQTLEVPLYLLHKVRFLIVFVCVWIPRGLCLFDNLVFHKFLQLEPPFFFGRIQADGFDEFTGWRLGIAVAWFELLMRFASAERILVTKGHTALS